MGSSFHALALATSILLGGCHALPELSISTERLRIGKSFDAPICEGTLDAFDEHVGGVELALAQPRLPSPILLYWLDDVSDQCGSDAGGCFFPGTRVVFAKEQSITHEIVHAVLDSTATSYFVEEGIAELYSGADVYYRPSPERGRPADALRMSPSQYRKGGLDYAAAAHFMRYVYATKGELAMKELAGTIASGGGTKAIEEELEDIFDDSIEDIEQGYFNDARDYYPGFAADTVEEAPVDRLRDGIRVELDCDESDTRGPLFTDTGGVYHVRWVRFSRTGMTEISLDAESGGWVYLFDPIAHSGSVTNWAIPEPAIDGDAIRLVAGETVNLEMTKGLYLAVFGGDDDRTELELRVRMEQPPGPIGEQG